MPPSTAAATPVQRKEAAPPGATIRPGATIAEDPFALHLLDAQRPDAFTPGTPQPKHWRLSPSEAELERQVGNDYLHLTRTRYAVPTFEAYVAKVRHHFKSLDAYLAWRSVSNEILTRPVRPGSKKVIADLVEHHGEEQRVFFYWVSWGYHDLGLTPDAMVETIVAQMSPALRKALAAAEAESGTPIKAQGFNPRPQKDDGQRYLLDTLSEHAQGTAIDVSPATNPILAVATWKAIQDAVDLHFDRSPARWERDPIGLCDDVVALDQAWATAVKAAYDKRRIEQAGEQFVRSHQGLLLDELGAGPKHPRGVSLLGSQPRLLDDATLRLEAVKSLLGRTTREAPELAALPGFHFFDQDPAVIRALRNQGLVWGITFPRSVDLHHFELRDPPLRAWDDAAPGCAHGP